MAEMFLLDLFWNYSFKSFQAKVFITVGFKNWKDREN